MHPFYNAYGCNAGGNVAEHLYDDNNSWVAAAPPSNTPMKDIEGRAADRPRAFILFLIHSSIH